MQHIGWIRPVGRDFWKPVVKGGSQAECAARLKAHLERSSGEGEWAVLPFDASPDAPPAPAADVFAEARALARRLRPPPGKSLEERLGMR